MRGEIVSLQLFDVGGTFGLKELRERLQRLDPRAGPSVGKGTPPYVEFPTPLIVDLEPVTVHGPLGDGAAKVTLVYFPIGAVSVRFRHEFEVPALKQLQGWSQSQIGWKGRLLSIEQAARAILDDQRPGWEAAIRDPYTKSVIYESYTVYAVRDLDAGGGEPFLTAHGREVAALLKGEDGSRLHEKEVREALRAWFSYYDDDLTVIDWDAAFIADASPEYEDLVFVLEIANLQLLEFRAYDDYLDDVLVRAYDELAGVFRRPGLFSSARRTAHDLSLLRMEIAELADEADNITKFLGDWFLARVYAAAQEKFHLGSWRSNVDDKLATLHQLYLIANQESDNRRLLTLEVMIVLLFVLDLVVLVLL